MDLAFLLWRGLRFTNMDKSIENYKGWSIQYLGREISGKWADSVQLDSHRLENGILLSWKSMADREFDTEQEAVESALSRGKALADNFFAFRFILSRP